MPRMRLEDYEHMLEELRKAGWGVTLWGLMSEGHLTQARGQVAAAGRSGDGRARRSAAGR